MRAMQRSTCILCIGLVGAVDFSSRTFLSPDASRGASFHRTALLTVCFSSPTASPDRHSASQLTDGCLLNIASFKMARPNSDVLVIAPAKDMVADKIKKVSRKDKSIKVATVGMGPWNISGQSIPFTNDQGKFFGNSLKLLWYTQVMTANKGNYDYIFIADGADIFFQRDPFDLIGQYPAADLIFFGDRNDRVQSGVEFFRRMMPLCSNQTYNKPTLLEEVQQSFTQDVHGTTYGVYANSGLILGKASAMLELTSKVAQTAAECHYWKSDQSIVNLIRYFEMKRRGANKVLIFPDMNKSVSMGKYYWNKYTEDGWLANKVDNEKLYVVHQYDRSPQRVEVTALGWRKVAGWIHDHA